MEARLHDGDHGVGLVGKEADDREDFVVQEHRGARLQLALVHKRQHVHVVLRPAAAAHYRVAAAPEHTGTNVSCCSNVRARDVLTRRAAPCEAGTAQCARVHETTFDALRRLQCLQPWREGRGGIHFSSMISSSVPTFMGAPRSSSTCGRTPAHRMASCAFNIRIVSLCLAAAPARPCCSYASDTRRQAVRPLGRIAAAAQRSTLARSS